MNADKITKQFYDRFRKLHQDFQKHINGIDAQDDREWYASLMLNRLMFIYFVQKKNFLDGDGDYLKNRLNKVKEGRVQGKSRSFYRMFLIPLFHDGLAKPETHRAQELSDLLGKVPYLNGGIFDAHRLERSYPDIQIPDDAFEQIFDFFADYQWHLDERPRGEDNEVTPDVLGHIFEKYINQNQMGAYYTNEDITEYITRNTVIPFLFGAAQKECPIAFNEGGNVWSLLRADPDRYIYPSIGHGITWNARNGEPTPLEKPYRLPSEVANGIDDVSNRGEWNRPAPHEYALPTETWREVVARRQRYEHVRLMLVSGEIREINDLITMNLDIARFAEDAISFSEGPELVRSFWHAMRDVSVLDPTCGSGAFLFATLNILDPLYTACLDSMRRFVDDIDKSGRTHTPDGLKDFRTVLEQVKQHPSQRYFTLKSIVISNLYGVDIMDEALEICKLRLFLKLVAQLEGYEQIARLPDIDFNIKSGNTLVGFTSLSDVRDVITTNRSKQGNGESKLVMEEPQETFKNIEVMAEAAGMAFCQFQAMQINHCIRPEEFTNAKVNLHSRLEELADELNFYLASDYGVDPDTSVDYEKWLAGHKPFHWFTEFYGVMASGGFNVIIGNPPYVRYGKVRSQYKIRNYLTESTGNLYAFVMERAMAIAIPKAWLGMIVPIASVSTGRMSKLQSLYKSSLPKQWHSHYATRPGKLFPGVDMNLTITIGQLKGTGVIPNTFTTTYYRWKDSPDSDRESLFYRLRFLALEVPSRHANNFPKMGTNVESSILSKMHSHQKKLKDFYDDSAEPIFYHSGGRYWRKALREGLSSHYKKIMVRESFSTIALCLLNSQLYYLYWITNSNCMDVVSREVSELPVWDFHSTSNLGQFRELENDLLESYYSNAERRDRKGQLISASEINFDVVQAKPTIDKIDRVIAKHYGFTEEELDFVINYDIKYRT